MNDKFLILKYVGVYNISNIINPETNIGQIHLKKSNLTVEEAKKITQKTISIEAWVSAEDCVK